MEFQARERIRTSQPCAACKTLRRRCDGNCLLAPYFPSDEMEKFLIVHKVFGASNVIKMIQMVEETRREDTMKALVYEATSRLRDPIYGTTRTIFYLQKMVEELQAQLESTKVQILNLQQEKDEVLSILLNANQFNLLSHMEMEDPLFYGTNLELDYDVMANDYEPSKQSLDRISTNKSLFSSVSDYMSNQIF